MSTDAVDNTMLDNPETPAPVFAFRAFKQALFGTPKVTDTERKPRRRDLDARTSHRQSQIPRRSEANHRQASSALASPAKGCLVTPGTANNRRKTVSFGSREQVQAQLAREEKEKEKATPREIPGRFPTPHAKAAQQDVFNDGLAAGSKRPASSGSLAEDHDSLSQRFKRLSTEAQISSKPSNRRSLLAASKGESFFIWDENAPPKASQAVSAPAPAPILRHDSPLEDDARPTDPVDDAAYWKEQYNEFAARSTREVKKLIKKEQVARKYAKEKDRELGLCQGSLARERQRVQKLESRVARLEAQVPESKTNNTDSRKAEGSNSRPTSKDKTSTPPKFDLFRDSQRKLQRPASQGQALATKHDRGRDVMSSDIWAEAALDVPAEKSRRPRRRASSSRPVQEPSKPALDLERGYHGARADEEEQVEPIKEAKPTLPLTVDNGPPKASESGMTAERREAARKRLEERKRHRAVISNA